MIYTSNSAIEAQEAQDRYVAVECLKWLLRKGTDLETKPTQISDYVDLNCSIIDGQGNKIPFNVEIKERLKTAEQLIKYPHAELKVDKFNRMRSVTPPGTRLLYMVLLNKTTCLIFNLDTLDWTKVQTKKWRIKRT